MSLVSRITIATMGLLITAMAAGQTTSYNQLVAQAQADLKAGNAAQALEVSQKAIVMTPSRWEAYVVAGGALQTEQQYDKAIDDFTKALEHAPAAKQQGVKNLLQNCMKAQIAARSTPTPAATASAPAPQQPSSPAAATNDGPSYADTVKWIQEKMKLAAPAPQTMSSPGLEQAVSHSETVQFDGCNSFTITYIDKDVINDLDKPSNSDVSENHIEYRLPVSSIVSVLPDAWSPRTGIIHGVLFVVLPNSVSWHAWTTDDNPSSQHAGGNSESSGIDDGSGADATKSGLDQVHDAVVNANGVQANPAYSNDTTVYLGFSQPGVQDIPTHMVAAFKHLIQVCKEHPEEAPKSLF